MKIMWSVATLANAICVTWNIVDWNPSLLILTTLSLALSSLMLALVLE